MYQVRGSNTMAALQDMRDSLAECLGGLKHKMFAVVHLDAGRRVIDFVEMVSSCPTIAGKPVPCGVRRACLVS